MLIAGLLLSSCCSPSKRMIALNYINADESLGVQSDKLIKEFDEITEMEITVPEGFEIGEIPITLDNGHVLNYEVILSDPTVDEGYEYTIQRTIKFTLPAPARNYACNVDLTTVCKKRIDINLSSSLYNLVHNGERGAAPDDIRMYFVTINPNNIVGNLMKLTPENVVRQERFKLNDRLTGNTYSGYFEYKECVMLVYQKVYGAREIPTIYSEVNHFTPQNKIQTKSGIEYVEFNVAQRGNTYYTYSINSDTRLFYIGYVQEGFTLDIDIPNYTASIDLGIEMKKNAFYLMSNLERRNSDFMSIDVYSSVNESYVSGNSSMDRVSGVVIKKTSEDAIVRNKYSTYSMYIGEDKSTDVLLNNEEKAALRDDIYIRIRSKYDLGNFEFILNECEKPQNTRAKTINLGEGSISDKGEYYIKIDKSIVADFTLSMIYSDGDYVYPYKTGSAIFYVEIRNYFSSNEMGYIGNSSDNSTWNAVTSIRTEFNIPDSSEEAALINYYDYAFEFYVDEDGDGENVDYGYVDYHKDNYSTGTITYFDTSELYEFDPSRAIGVDPNPDNYNHYSFRGNLYLNIYAPAYRGAMYPVISAIGFNGNYVLVNDVMQKLYPVSFEYATTHNGVFSIPINIGNRYMGDQYEVSITIKLATASNTSHVIDFSDADFPINNNGDGIYITNNVYFETYTDFTFINFANKNSPSGVTLGYNVDVYYFGTMSALNDIDIHLAQNDTSSIISYNKVLVDILGQKVQVRINGVSYDVMVMYQQSRLFEEFEGNYFAY